MAKLFSGAASGVAVLVSAALSVLVHSMAVAPQQDIVEQLLPGGAIPRDVLVKPEQRDRIIKRLRAERTAADAQRGQKVAFLMAALNEDYGNNRDYLLHVLSGCNYPEIRYGCDDMAGFYLIYLYEHGHQEILAPLLKTGLGSYNAAGSEGLGAYFGAQVQNHPEEFLEAVRTFPVSIQKRVCGFAGSSDGGGLGAKGLLRARKKLRMIGGDVAVRCLREIEVANKPE